MDKTRGGVDSLDAGSKTTGLGLSEEVTGETDATKKLAEEALAIGGDAFGTIGFHDKASYRKEIIDFGDM